MTIHFVPTLQFFDSSLSDVVPSQQANENIKFEVHFPSLRNCVMYLSFVHINSGKHSLAVLLNCIHMSYEWVCLLGPRITYIPRAKTFSGSVCQIHKIIALHESHQEEKKLSYRPCTFFLACSKQLLLEQRKRKLIKITFILHRSFLSSS